MLHSFCCVFRRSYRIVYGMPKRSSKKKTTPKKSKRAQAEDVNELAVRIVEATTEQEQPEMSKNETSGKNPAAVTLGRLGGLKGGKARAEKLSEQERSEIARKAAIARWSRKER